MNSASPAIASKHAEMVSFLSDLNERTLGAYGLRRSLLKEHYGIEQSVLAGGYGYRQILELIQNGADAILEAHEDGYGSEGRIEVLLTGPYLYVANTGAPLAKEGVDALLTSHNSPKRGNQIGRFGLGFKSLLRLGGAIDVFSTTWGAIRFDPKRCRHEIIERFGVEEAPALRLAWSPEVDGMAADSRLAELSWAENGELGPCYSMVTTAASPLMAQIHDRMPALLRPEEMAGFLVGTGHWNFQPFTGPLAVTPCESPLKSPQGRGSRQELF